MGHRFSPAALRARAARRGLSMNSLAARCGVSYSAVWSWFNGRAEPSCGRAMAAAKVLGCSLGDLVEPDGTGGCALPPWADAPHADGTDPLAGMEGGWARREREGRGDDPGAPSLRRSDFLAAYEDDLESRRFLGGVD